MTSLAEMLDDVSVDTVDDYHNEANDGKLDGIMGWYSVSTGDESVIAYFADERLASFFRLALINARINPLAYKVGEEAVTGE